MLPHVCQRYISVTSYTSKKKIIFIISVKFSFHSFPVGMEWSILLEWNGHSYRNGVGISIGCYDTDIILDTWFWTHIKPTNKNDQNVIEAIKHGHMSQPTRSFLGHTAIKYSGH